MSTDENSPTRGRETPRVGRPKKYTRDRILEASLKVAKCIGLDALSMQDVASELETSPSTLYRYIDGRERLIAETAERLATQLDVPPPTSADASPGERRDWFVNLAILTRDRLLTVRGAADYVLLHGPTGPSGLRYMATVCEVIAQTGRSPREVAHAYDLLLTNVSAYTSKTERLELAGGSQRMAGSLSNLYDATGAAAPLKAVLAEITGDSDGSFHRAIGQVVDWIVSWDARDGGHLSRVSF